MEGYEKLIVWQKSMELFKQVYASTKGFPKSEIFGLTSQMNRAAVSIPSNIAEGYRRGSKKEFVHFLRNSFGSGAELETQFKIVVSLGFVKEKEILDSLGLLGEIMRLLNEMINNPKLFSFLLLSTSYLLRINL